VSERFSEGSRVEDLSLASRLDIYASGALLAAISWLLLPFTQFKELKSPESLVLA